jgi:fructuronate reductase
MRYVAGTDEAGAPIDVRDPLADLLRDRVTDTPARTVAALLAVPQVFPADLATHLAGPVTHAAALLWSKGARAAAQQVTS